MQALDTDYHTPGPRDEHMGGEGCKKKKKKKLEKILFVLAILRLARSLITYVELNWIEKEGEKQEDQWGEGEKNYSERDLDEDGDTVKKERVEGKDEERTSEPGDT